MHAADWESATRATTYTHHKHTHTKHTYAFRIFRCVGSFIGVRAFTTWCVVVRISPLHIHELRVSMCAYGVEPNRAYTQGRISAILYLLHENLYTMIL